MAKKTKESGNETPNPSNIPNKDVLQRLNFLYQASNILSNITLEGSSSSSPRASNTKTIKSGPVATGVEQHTATSIEDVGAKSIGRKRRTRRQINTHLIARTLIGSMKAIGQKTNVRMDPSVKRTVCKQCNSLLWPGSTATVRVKPLPSHGHAVWYGCNCCGSTRRIPAPPLLEPNQVEQIMATTGDEPIAGSQESGQLQKKRRKKALPRPLPFFAREGHTVFCGNEVVQHNAETPTGGQLDQAKINNET